MDDHAIILNNLGILSDFKNIHIAFTTDAFLNKHGDYYRPIQTVSFMIDAFIGKEKPWIYHLTELMYHLLTVISLYYLLIFIQLKKTTAFLFALLFSLHPLLAAAISWVPARGDVLIGLFGILLLLSFTQYFKTKKPIYLLVHSLLFLTASFTKETTILFPFIFILFYFIHLKQKIVFKEWIPFIIIWLGAITVFMIARSNVVIGTPPDFIFGIQPFIQNIATIPIAIGKFFIPVNLSTLPLFETSFTGIGCILLLVILIYTIKDAKNKKLLPAFGLVWFFAFIIPPMFFKLFFSEFIVEYYEHRMYLPIIGLIITLAFWFNAKLTQSVSKNIIWLPIIAIAIFTPISSVHSDHFKNSMGFFTRAAELNNPGAITKRAEIYMNEGDINNAIIDIEKAIETSNNEYPIAFYNKGLINLHHLKNYKEAENDFTTTLLLDSTHVESYIARANARTLLSNPPGALADLTIANRLTPNNPKVYYQSAKANVIGEDYTSALNNFDKTISLDSFFSEAYNDRAFVKYKLKEYKEAIKDCEKAIELNPMFLNAYYNKGIIFYEQGLSDSAINQLDITLSLANNFYFGYFYRGMAKLQKKDMKGACSDWQESLKLGFTMAQDTISKYCK